MYIYNICHIFTCVSKGVHMWVIQNNLIKLIIRFSILLGITISTKNQDVRKTPKEKRQKFQASLPQLKEPSQYGSFIKEMKRRFFHTSATAFSLPTKVNFNEILKTVN